MSVLERFFLRQIILVLSLEVAAIAPVLAVDAEAAAKKDLCHTCLKNIYLAEHRYNDALAEFQSLLVTRPNDARLHYECGNVLLQTGKLAMAVPHMRTAVKLKPDVSEFQAGLGAACLYNKNYDAAVAAYTKACQMGGKYDKQLQIAQQYQAQQKQLIQYEKKIEQKKEDDEE